MRVINQQAARSAAEEALRAMSSDPAVPPLAITHVEERPGCWIFYYQSVRYVQTGSFLDSVAGNAPILVDWNTGQPHVTGTARSTEYYLAEFADGRHTCELCCSPGSTPQL
ncbi:YrhB domain-containing protein [Micromonospora sp. WMMD737]|uniref:YrhB domain-containing protein n=1 Tax=Micromonospora sp. WMMD737 TaxID=3404113 RepID=UPI003B95AD42